MSRDQSPLEILTDVATGKLRLETFVVKFDLQNDVVEDENFIALTESWKRRCG